MQYDWIETVAEVHYPGAGKDGQPAAVTVLRFMMPREPTLYQVMSVVCPYIGTDDIERVRVFYDPHGYCDMFVDDDGIRKALPVNATATAVYQANTLAHVDGASADALPKVYGTAVLFRRRVWF